MLASTTAVLEGLADRRPLEGHGGHAGAGLERARLADGTPVVLKHVRPARDPVLVALRDPGREALLVLEGLLDRLPPETGHAVRDVVVDGDGWVLVLDDMSPHLVTWDRPLCRADGRRVLAGLAQVHDRLRTVRPASLAPMHLLWSTMAPSSLALAGLPVGEDMHRGWSRVLPALPRDLASVIDGIHRRPANLSQLLGGYPCTVVHGDVYPGNLALLPDRIVLLDWGMFTCVAPGEVDAALWLAMSAHHVQASIDEQLDDVRLAFGDRLDESALRLAMLGALAALGWTKEPGSADLAWWVDQAQPAVELMVAAPSTSSSR